LQIVEGGAVTRYVDPPKLRQYAEFNLVREGYAPVSRSIATAGVIHHIGIDGIPGGYEASAFIVERVEYPIRSFSPPSVEWFYEKKRIWKNGIEGRPGVMLPYPTMGEYLIRPGGTHRMQQISAVLKLKPPYLAYVGS
jgi:hypothetical protein